MSITRILAVALLACRLGTAAEPGDSGDSRVEAARMAGIELQLVLNADRRSELVEALRHRIVQGYVDEQVYKQRVRSGKVREWNYSEERDKYIETQAKGFDRALFLAGEFRCVELVPLIVELGEMNVLNEHLRDPPGLAPPSIRAMRAMGPAAIPALFRVIETSHRARERYYALEVLGSGATDWKDELNGQSMADKMESECDTSLLNVRLALAFLRGEIALAGHAVGEDGPPKRIPGLQKPNNKGCSGGGAKRSLRLHP